MEPGVRDRLAGVKADIASLEQYEENLLSRVQQLQDAATAFISIEQNDVVKVLTIASVVGVPPVMVVGLYGMNFKYMPELGWRYGYPYALALIVVSTVIRCCGSSGRTDVRGDGLLPSRVTWPIFRPCAVSRLP